MKTEKGTLIKSIAIPLLVGVVAGLLSRNGMEVFEMVNKPPLSPPVFLFPIVWTILYILMGISAYLIIKSDANPEEKTKALKIYIYQLIVNFLWPIFFFNLKWYFFSFLWILLLWVLIIVMIREFSRISKTAGYLLIPYLLWVTFATYLTFAIWALY